MDCVLYGTEDRFTIDISNGSNVVFTSDRVLSCFDGFSEDAVYGCCPKGGFRGCRIKVNGVFYWVKRISADMKIITLEESPKILTEGNNQLLGRNAEIFNSNSKGSFNKAAFLDSKSMDDLDITTLFLSSEIQVTHCCNLLN